MDKEGIGRRVGGGGGGGGGGWEGARALARVCGLCG